jgi:hypothetical protein
MTLDDDADYSCAQPACHEDPFVDICAGDVGDCVQRICNSCATNARGDDFEYGFALVSKDQSTGDAGQ